MANPFSGTITGKNTGHTNQANLVYALVPRSTTVVKEIITDTNATLSGAAIGSYDADGYISGSSASSVSTAELSVTGLSQSGNVTIIAGWKWAGGSPSSFSPGCGMYRNAASYELVQFQLDGFDRRCRPWVADGAREFLGSYVTTSSDHIGMGVATSAGAQKGGYVQAASSPPSGTYTSFGTDVDTNTGGTMDRLFATFNSSWVFQYLFVYNAYLSDANIETIIENPGDVLAQGGGTLALSGSGFSSLSGTLPPTIAIPL